MNLESITNQKSFLASEIARYSMAIRLLDTFGERLSDSTTFAPSYYLQVTVDNREDLALFMTLAPTWKKSAVDGGIAYDARVDGERFQIIAKAAAIPPTCRMIEEEYIIPAVPEQPSRIGRRMVLKCDQPATVEPAATPVDVEVLV